MIPRNYNNIDNNIAKELNFDEKNYLFQLEYISILTVEGKQAKSFLQGQLTCNLDDVTLEQMRPAAQCNLQGRILALMDVVKCNEEKYFLVLPKDLIETTIKSLKQVAQLSRVNLYANNDLVVYGLRIQDRVTLQDYLIKLPNESMQVISEENYYCYKVAEEETGIFKLLLAPTLAQKLSENFHLKGSLAWHLLNLKQNIFEIYPESRGLFLPHKVALQKTSVISFNKGCYKGQEIIARMHYRSTVKYKLQQKIMPNTTLIIGQKELNDPNQEVAQLIDYAPIDEQHLLTLWSEIDE